jgi:hypothetical protein
MYLRPAYLIACGVVLSGLGRGRLLRSVCEVAGTLVILAGIVDLIVHTGH